MTHRPKFRRTRNDDEGLLFVLAAEITLIWILVILPWDAKETHALLSIFSAGTIMIIIGFLAGQMISKPKCFSWSAVIAFSIAMLCLAAFLFYANTHPEVGESWHKSR